MLNHFWAFLLSPGDLRQATTLHQPEEGCDQFPLPPPSLHLLPEEAGGHLGEGLQAVGGRNNLTPLGLHEGRQQLDVLSVVIYDE